VNDAVNDAASDDAPTVGELLELVERLDADNERLRMKALELGRLVEDAVTARVAVERAHAELRERYEVLDAELKALAGTRVLRAARPFRSAYGRLRRWWGGSRG
jgi:hypothetical protein